MKTRFYTIAPGEPCYLIAELSHNHQGSGDIALQLVEAAAESGAHAVKFQKRNNETLYTAAYLQSPYEGPNSFGCTYGEHRAALEPRLEWLLSANSRAHELGLDFVMTVFDLESLDFCERNLLVDAYKIQSGDLTYPTLIRAVAATGKPYFISCGAASLPEISDAHRLCTTLATPFVMLYAVSAYPTEDGQINLRRLVQLQNVLRTPALGLSCHHSGIAPALLARALGCVAVEKHLTLDKSQRGPDHHFSLSPEEFRALSVRLAETDEFMGRVFSEDSIEAHQQDAQRKMGKSGVAVRALEPGEVVKPEDVRYQSPAGGMSPKMFEKFLRQPLTKQLREGDYFSEADFK